MSANPFADLVVPDVAALTAQTNAQTATSVAAIAQEAKQRDLHIVATVPPAPRAPMPLPVTRAPQASSRPPLPRAAPTASNAATAQPSTSVAPFLPDTQGLIAALDQRPKYAEHVPSTSVATAQSTTTASTAPVATNQSVATTNATTTTTAQASKGAEAPKVGTILVSPKQRGNPLLKYIRHVSKHSSAAEARFNISGKPYFAAGMVGVQ